MVKPRRGRQNALSYYFVRALAITWHRLTGGPPTRSFDPYKGKDSGHFLAFCSAGAETRWTRENWSTRLGRAKCVLGMAGTRSSKGHMVKMG
jgi:hypothetical protein